MDVYDKYIDEYRDQLTSNELSYAELSRTMEQQEPKLKDVLPDTIRRTISRRMKERNIRHEPRLAAKILLFDIETLPIINYNWGVWQQNIAPVMIIKDWCMLMWSAKWLYDSDIKSDILTPKEAINRRDKRISQSIWDLLNQADIVIAHNLNKFDRKRVNTRLLMNDIPPPSPYQRIDTLTGTRQQFAFSHNKLDYLGQLKLKKAKLKTEFELWKKCDNGDQEALDYMDKYCKKDTLLLEEWYLEIRPWITSHPNVLVHGGAFKEGCHRCGSTKLHWKSTYGTTVNRYKAYQCNDCKGYGHARKSDLAKAERELLTTSVAR